MGCNIKLVFMYINFFLYWGIRKNCFLNEGVKRDEYYENDLRKYSNEIFKWYFLETLKLEKTLNQVLKPLYISPLLPE